MKPFWIKDAWGNLVNIGHFAAVEKQLNKTQRGKYDLFGVFPNGERLPLAVGKSEVSAAKAMEVFSDYVCIEFELTNA